MTPAACTMQNGALRSASLGYPAEERAMAMAMAAQLLHPTQDAAATVARNLWRKALHATASNGLNAALAERLHRFQSDLKQAETLRQESPRQALAAYAQLLLVRPHDTTLIQAVQDLARHVELEQDARSVLKRRACVAQSRLGEGLLQHPFAVAHRNGTTYVTDLKAKAVLRFDEQGRSLGPLPGLGLPLCLACDQQGLLWVCDHDQSAAIAFDGQDQPVMGVDTVARTGSEVEYPFASARLGQSLFLLLGHKGKAIYRLARVDLDHAASPAQRLDLPLLNAAADLQTDGDRVLVLNASPGQALAFGASGEPRGILDFDTPLPLLLRMGAANGALFCTCQEYVLGFTPQGDLDFLLNLNETAPGGQSLALDLHCQELGDALMLRVTDIQRNCVHTLRIG